MRRLLLPALLVPLLAGCGSGGHSTSSAREALASQVEQDIPRWIEDEQLPAAAKSGTRVFATAGCTACHTYDGAGTSNLGAPDLTAIGRGGLGSRVPVAHPQCPARAH